MAYSAKSSSGTRKTRGRRNPAQQQEDLADSTSTAAKTRPGLWQAGRAVELDLHALDLRYAGLRRRETARERALVASLAEHGQQVPVVVVRDAADAVILVDGFKRVRALTRLHHDTVAAVCWPLGELEALLLAHGLRRGADPSALEEGWLLHELHARFGLAAGELARRFAKSASWVSRRLALVRELPEAVQELVRRGALAAHAAMKHLVPLARANRDACLALAPVLAAHGCSSRQVGTLCAAFVAGTAASRELILTAPQLVLDAATEARRPPAAKSVAERVLADVAAVAAVARRARRLVAAHPGQGATWDARGDLAAAVAAAAADTAALFTLLRKELPHAGREHPHRDPETP